MEVFDVLSDLKDKVQVDARQRKFVWPDGKRLTLQESIERARKRYPDISSKQIEEHLLYWTESGFAPAITPGSNLKSWTGSPKLAIAEIERLLGRRGANVVQPLWTAIVDR